MKEKKALEKELQLCRANMKARRAADQVEEKDIMERLSKFGKSDCQSSIGRLDGAAANNKTTKRASGHHA